ncbi:glutathione synthetase-like isoform X2 [Homarus americanus]|uniref:glutathione synthetase-like isoform X2 n=1 Tax=Homarus americanus TaxID=6706 RepID=UPI001C44D9F8|nr:glutathione synthetase-like isoform X2 [Homarus americanus]
MSTATIMSVCNNDCSDCCDGTSDKSENCRKITTTVLEPCVPLPLSDEVLDDILPKAKDYALLHGAGMRYKASYDQDTLQMAPFFLLPSAFPRREFERVVKLQPLINVLMHKIAHNHEFLENCLKKTVKVDDFTGRLWKIYTTVREEGMAQWVSLGMFRCDYLYSVPSQSAQQVEINTIASSFGALSSRIVLMHRYVLGELRRPDLLPHLPENNALSGLCSGMVLAWEAYKCPKSVILFVIEDVTYNICDQRFHEFEIRRQRPELHVIRRNLTQISQTGQLTDDKRLIIDGDEVAVVYFRAGYEPGHYHSEAEWEARLTIERSRAIKSPSIQCHLAGTKKVQQEIARPGILKKFLPDSEAELVSNLFTGLYTLDLGAEGDAAIRMATEDPERFVLKPQREGGGNNFYGDEIRTVLEKMKDSSEREAYILMDRIRPPVQHNYLVRPHESVKLVEVVSELGIFGVVLGTDKEITINTYSGHMLRTKPSSVNEGGVAAGLGALDSVFLFD